MECRTGNPGPTLSRIRALLERITGGRRPTENRHMAPSELRDYDQDACWDWVLWC